MPSLFFKNPVAGSCKREFRREKLGRNRGAFGELFLHYILQGAKTGDGFRATFAVHGCRNDASGITGAFAARE